MSISVFAGVGARRRWPGCVVARVVAWVWAMTAGVAGAMSPPVAVDLPASSTAASAVTVAPGPSSAPSPASTPVGVPAAPSSASWPLSNEGWRGGFDEGPVRPESPHEPWWQRLNYLWLSADGHMRMLRSARPVSEWLGDPATPEALRERLGLTVQMREFSVRVLGLPDNASYRRYVDLGRAAAVWNVVAAPPLSLQPKTWCFPVVGCVGYRGYHDPQQAQAMAQQLKALGWEVHVYPVPAYSTLGRMPGTWLADPLLNTFVKGSETGLAGLMFHELSHQVAYATDDTTFNESYATAVERIGTRLWLAQRGTAGQAQIEVLKMSDVRRAGFEALTRRYRDELTALYASPVDDRAKRTAKAALYRRMWDDYRVLRDSEWGGDRRYDTWFAEANNARFALLSTYTRLVPEFEALFDRCGRDMARFHAQVQRLAKAGAAVREKDLRMGACAAGAPLGR